MNGESGGGQAAYTEAVQISQAAGNIHMVIITNSNLADILMEQGQLHQAARIYSETLQMATRPDGQSSPLAERALCRIEPECLTSGTTWKLQHSILTSALSSAGSGGIWTCKL